MLHIACSDAGPTAINEAPPPPGIEEVHVTLAFGDPPLAGELRIKPTQGPSEWGYSVDIDGDRSPDEKGRLGLGVTIGYRFETPGVHRISIDLEHDGERHRIDRHVVVNDPSAVRILAQGLVESGSGGMVVHPSGQTLFVVAQEHRLLHQRASDLATIWTLPLPGIRYENGYSATGGIALGDDVAFIDDGDSLVAVRVEGAPAVLGTVAPAHWGSQLHRRRDGRLYVGGYAGIGLVDPATGGTVALAACSDASDPVTSRSQENALQ